VTTEYVDPDIELRRIHAVRLEREPDERGQCCLRSVGRGSSPTVPIVGVQPNPVQSTDAQRSERPIVLEASELALH
jgi:hypothetical protein